MEAVLSGKPYSESYLGEFVYREEKQEVEVEGEEEVESPRLFNSFNISRLNISFNAGKMTHQRKTIKNTK